tara:strand:- start:18963 stop:19400 length:438 start_codon:yes stop_codon:yes gene_type:complete
MNAATRVSFALTLLFSVGCSGEFVPQEGSDLNGGGGGGGRADAGTIAAGSAEGEAFFLANIQQLMTIARPLGQCTVCHEGTNVANGPLFLGLSPAENYQAILNANLLGPTPLESRLYTRGVHAGDAFAANEAIVVSEWIRIEAQN